MKNITKNFILPLNSRIFGRSLATYSLITGFLLGILLLGGAPAFAANIYDQQNHSTNIDNNTVDQAIHITATASGVMDNFEIYIGEGAGASYTLGQLRILIYGSGGGVSCDTSNQTSLGGTTVTSTMTKYVIPYSSMGCSGRTFAVSGAYTVEVVGFDAPASHNTKVALQGATSSADDAYLSIYDSGGYVSPATCVDGIENGDETGVDIGGSCAVLEISTPADTTTLENFDKWQVHASHIDDSDSLSSIVVFYSDDSAKLTECDEFPYGAHGYTDCFYDTTRIWYDESPQFSGGIFAGDHTYPILKAETLTTGKTYYAKAYLRSPNLSGATSNVITSSTISFTIGIPTVVSPAPTSCATFDIACYLKIALSWAFIPSDTSIHQFTTLVNFDDPASSLLATKLPFSYGFDIPVMWNELFDTSASGTLGISVPLLGGGTGDLLSATTISANSWYGSVVRPFISIGLYLMAFWIVYKKVFGIHDQSHKTV